MANFPTYVNQNYYLGEGVEGANVKRVQGIPKTGEDGVFFLNEFSDKPLYRAPNNGAAYRISTLQYRAKNCLYVSNGDTNGLAYWAGTSFGTSAWRNNNRNNRKIIESAQID